MPIEMTNHIDDAIGLFEYTDHLLFRTLFEISGTELKEYFLLDVN